MTTEIQVNSGIQHLVDWRDWNHQEIKDLLEFAQCIENDRFRFQGYLQNRTLVMLFQKTSTRTRISFEAGITELGGHGIYMDWQTSNFGLSKIEYETHYLSRNVDLIMARLIKHEDLIEMKHASTVPLINGCCNMYHPCQALADMLTIAQDRGAVKGARLTYIGVHNNVVNSLMSISLALEVQLTLVCPIAEDDAIDHEVKSRLQQQGLLNETLDAKSAVENAEYVYTDTWIDMEYFNNPKYKELKEKRLNFMLPYQVNENLLSHSSAKIMHDMPIHCGHEITDAIVNSDRSIIYDQAENRLIAQKAIMIRLLEISKIR